MRTAGRTTLLAVLLSAVLFGNDARAAPPVKSSSTAAVVSQTSSPAATRKTTATKSSAIKTSSSVPASIVSTTVARAISSTPFAAATTMTTNTTSFSLPAQSPSMTSVPADYIRGVNIGGWLILEPWMNAAVIGSSGAKDQLTFDSSSPSTAAAALQNHWSTYFTQGDVAGIAGFGLNALRIPIGFWAFDNNGTDFLSGAQDFLDQAISWARMYGLKVLVDVHGSPGSQNGWDHSGDASTAEWQVGSNTSTLGPNMERNIQVLKQVAAKYGSLAFADVVYAIQVANEPISWAPNDFAVTKNWAAVAYNAMMSTATNPNVQILMHDAFMGPQNWYDMSSAINSNLPSPQFALDVHLYQNMVAADATLDMTAHIEKACTWGNIAKNPLMPIYVGEFSAAVSVCVNPDGSSFGFDGTQQATCTVPGCQCTDTTSIDQWSPALKNVTRMYWEAQLQSFEHANAGYFVWSLHGFGAWSLVDLYNYGVIGEHINDRVYGKQCVYSV